MFRRALTVAVLVLLGCCSIVAGEQRNSISFRVQTNRFVRGPAVSFTVSSRTLFRYSRVKTSRNLVGPTYVMRGSSVIKSFSVNSGPAFFLDAGRNSLEMRCETEGRRGGPCDMTVTLTPLRCQCSSTNFRTSACSSGGAGSSVRCSICPRGSYCNGVTRTACPAGKFCPEGTVAGDLSSSSRLCAQGRYCEAGSGTGFGTGPCAAGYYCPGGSTTSRGSGKCPAGYYCPTGSHNPRGRICPGGSHCLEGSSTPTVCAEGFECPEGTDNVNGVACGVQHVCPRETPNAKICAVGFQRDTTDPLERNCVTCQDGFYCDGVGTEGGKQSCLLGFYCSNGQITRCVNTFCPVGSSTEGGPCDGFGTEDYDGVCRCYLYFGGSICQSAVAPISDVQVDFASVQFLAESLLFLQRDAALNCTCGTFSDGVSCVAAGDEVGLVSKFFRASVAAYKNASYVESLHGIEKALSCSLSVDWSSKRTEIVNVLNHMKRHLEGEKAVTMPLLGPEWRKVFTQTLVSIEHIMALADPSLYSMNFVFTPLSALEPFYEAMTPPFKYCSASKVAEFTQDCGTSIENVLAMTRCGLLLPEDLGGLSLLAQEKYVAQGLYCARSLRSLLIGQDEKVVANLALQQINEVASFVHTTYGPSSSTSSVLNLATTAALAYTAPNVTATVVVPVQPLLYFQNNLQSKIQSIQAFAAKIGRTKRFQLIANGIDALEDTIKDQVARGFTDLTSLLLQVHNNILEQLRIETVLDASLARTELTSLLETLETDVARIPPAVGQFVAYADVLGTSIGPSFITALAETVGSGFDEGQKQEIVSKAKGNIRLLRNFVNDMASIARALTGVPSKEALGAASSFVEGLRRRLDDPKTSLRYTKTNRRLSSCPTSIVTDDPYELLRSLSTRGADLVQGYEDVLESSSPRLTIALKAGLKTTLLAFNAALEQSGASDDLTQSSIASVFFGSYGNRALYTVQMAFTASGLNPNEQQTVLFEIVEEYLEEETTDSLSGRRLDGCNLIKEYANFVKRVKGFSILRPVSGITSDNPNFFPLRVLERETDVAGGALETAQKLQDLITETILVETQLSANFDENSTLLVPEFTGTVGRVASNMVNVSKALMTVAVALDFMQLGLSVDQITTAASVLKSETLRFSDSSWDDLLSSLIDLVELDGIICAPIAESQLVMNAGFLFKQSLNGKGAKSKGSRRTLQDSGLIQSRACRSLIQTLRSMVQWGKSIQETMFDVFRKYGTFISLLSKQIFINQRVDAQEEMAARGKARQTQFLQSIAATSSSQAEEVIKANMLAESAVDTGVQIMVVVDEVSRVVNEFCNAHRYVNPGSVPTVCSLDLFELERKSGDFEEFLLLIASKLGAVIEVIARNWFDIGYSSFARYDDELLDVTSLIDMDQFVASGYKNFTFTLNAPSVSALKGEALTAKELRGGPYFCNMENIGMTSFGIIFLNQTEEIVAMQREDLEMSISLSGPFYKTSSETRVPFSLRPYENFEYRYSRPRTVETNRFCRTDERPTLFGTICDKGRGVELETDGLNTQPLPSPYAKWDVKITRGSARLAELEVAGIKIIATFDATFNSKMTCIGEDISPYASSVQSKASTTQADENEVWAVAMFALIAIVSVGAAFAVYRRKAKDVLALDQDEHENEDTLDQMVSRHWGKIEVAYSKLQQSIEEL